MDVPAPKTILILIFPLSWFALCFIFSSPFRPDGGVVSKSRPSSVIVQNIFLFLNAI